jgi:hypothetical protein
VLTSHVLCFARSPVPEDRVDSIPLEQLLVDASIVAVSYIVLVISLRNIVMLLSTIYSNPSR